MRQEFTLLAKATEKYLALDRALQQSGDAIHREDEARNHLHNARRAMDKSSRTDSHDKLKQRQYEWVQALLIRRDARRLLYWALLDLQPLLPEVLSTINDCSD